MVSAKKLRTLDPARDHSERWIEDHGWTTMLDPLWNSRKTLAEGDHCNAFWEIMEAHVKAVFPAPVPGEVEGWGDYTGGRIEAMAFASILVGGNLGEPQTSTYYTVEATKIEVRLLASAPVEQEVNRSFLKGTKLDGGEEDFKMVTLTIRKGRLESDRIVLDPEIILDKTSKAYLIPVEIVPDYNRDGKINDKDRGKVTEDNPWRWWVNDDDDSGEFDSSGDKPDVPDGAASHQRDCNDGAVDGIRDLVDFFPLHLDLKQTLVVFPSSDYKYFLRRESTVSAALLGALWYPTAVLDKDPRELDSVGGFLRNLDQAADVAARPVEDITSDGLQIPPTMLHATEKGRGVVLLEGKFINFKPLIVEIRTNDGTSVAKIEFPLINTKVEEMYRHVDLRTVPVNLDGSDAGNVASPLGTKTVDPRYPYPDSLTNKKYFVFVHGYNVNEEKARGWFAEIFKRLHQMGSKARFVGVSWRGDAGLGGVDLPPDNFFGIEQNANYHKPVFFALQTGDALKDALSFTGKADVTIAAHSLGNMVVSHAIAKAKFSPNRYYMIDAAVAAEAYDSSSTQAQRYHMVDKDWKPQLEVIGGSLKATAARWYELFDDTDGRYDLKWENRFKVNKNLSDVYHFYSTGEEVLQNPEEEEDSAELSVVKANGLDRGSWVSQEFSKGTFYLASNTQDFNGLGRATRQAGWGFNSRYNVTRINGNGFHSLVLIPPAPETVASYSKEYLQENPVFRQFLVEGLTDPTLGSTLAQQKLVKYHVLASGIPALSFAAGSNPIGGEDMKDRRFDMQETFMTDAYRWPTEGHTGLSKKNWLHSDFYGVALSHVYKMYEKMIELGGLDDENKD